MQCWAPTLLSNLPSSPWLRNSLAFSSAANLPPWGLQRWPKAVPNPQIYLCCFSHLSRIISSSLMGMFPFPRTGGTPQNLPATAVPLPGQARGCWGKNPEPEYPVGTCWLTSPDFCPVLHRERCKIMTLKGPLNFFLCKQQLTVQGTSVWGMEHSLLVSFFFWLSPGSAHVTGIISLPW